LQRSYVDAWLDRVEGWGDQHIYLYRVPSGVSEDPVWTDSRGIQQKVQKAGFARFWNVRTSLKFPQTLTLTGIHFDGACLSFVWHQGLPSWVQDPDKDYEKTIGGDLYQFRAHRQRAERSVMRFVFRPKSRLAGVFIQVPWDKVEHDKALGEVRDSVSRLLEFNSLTPFSVALAIKGLDQASLNAKRTEGDSVKTYKTRLSGGGAYVEFASTSVRRGYQDIEPIRHVRRALNPKSFRGLHGVFLFRRVGLRGSTRDLKIGLYGQQRRIRLWAQMTADEVWEILETLKKYG